MPLCRLAVVETGFNYARANFSFRGSLVVYEIYCMLNFDMLSFHMLSSHMFL